MRSEGQVPPSIVLGPDVPPDKVQPGPSHPRGGPAGHANALGLVGILLLVVVVAVTTAFQLEAAQNARHWVRHTYAVLEAIQDLDLKATDAETGQRGYLLTGNADRLNLYEGAIERIPALESRLVRLTADNAAQQDRLRLLSPPLQSKLSELAETMKLRRNGGQAAALRLAESNNGRELMDRIKATLAEMTTAETRLLDQRMAAANRLSDITRDLTLGGCLLSLGLVAFAAYLLQRSRRQLIKSEAEQRHLAGELNASLDGISQGIGVFDADLRLTRWNAHLPALLALPQDMVQRGMSYAALAERLSDAGEGRGALLESEDQIRASQIGAGDAPIVFQRTRQADCRSFEFRRTVMPGGRMVLTVADITERTRTEAAVREAQRMQAIGQLTGGIAHDFNNLLSVITGNAELARHHLDPECSVAQRLDRIMWGARRGAELTQQLLAFARKQTLAPQPIDVSAILLELASLIRVPLGKYIQLRTVHAADLWPAMADAVQLENAILNLALNARDAMPGGGRLIIEAANEVLDDADAHRHADVAPGDYVMIAVSDTGIGMPPEVLARVFEPFFTTKGPDKGTGLGLSMVFGFAKQSGGHVNICSEQGEGTTVRLYLPRAVRAVQPSVQRFEARGGLYPGNATALLVEDAITRLPPKLDDLGSPASPTADVPREPGPLVLEERHA